MLDSLYLSELGLVFTLLHVLQQWQIPTSIKLLRCPNVSHVPSGLLQSPHEFDGALVTHFVYQ